MGPTDMREHGPPEGRASARQVPAPAVGSSSLSRSLKICDVTQFYSPLSGGVKRYLQEKIRFIQNASPGDEHILIVPGEENKVTVEARSRVYTVRSPLISRSAQYRALLDLRTLHEIIAREQPDIIESSDPYQLGWAVLKSGLAQRIPVVAFYHSHFSDAYLRRPSQWFGQTVSAALMKATQRYVRNLYNRYETTFVASPRLDRILAAWGVRNTRLADLGVNSDIFHPDGRPSEVRETLGIPDGRFLLLYVGRLAGEKNTATLFKAFSLLVERPENNFHLLVLGDGQQRDLLRRLVSETHRVTWLQYSTDSTELAKFYRAADLFVHPSVEETFGLVALEAQACGTPVVGIRGSCLDDLIQHDQHSWATENNPVALADAIEAMCARPLKKMGDAAAAVVAERYSWPRVFERLFCVYHEVRARYRKGRG
ncbi:MAG: glycosyltransferase [Chthoniobacterales bacterium]|nr:glycosyltransferase [Chthoniobacterales bacterium]